jgi:hypothetical protein
MSSAVDIPLKGTSLDRPVPSWHFEGVDKEQVRLRVKFVRFTVVFALSISLHGFVDPL